MQRVFADCNHGVAGVCRPCVQSAIHEAVAEAKAEERTTIAKLARERFIIVRDPRSGATWGDAFAAALEGRV